MQYIKRSKTLILALSLILCAIIGLSFIPNNKIIAKADTTNVEYRFTGSNIFLPFLGTTENSGINKGFSLSTFEFAPILNSSSFTNKYQVVLRCSAFYVYNTGGTNVDNFFNILVSYTPNHYTNSMATHTLDTLPLYTGALPSIDGYLTADNRSVFDYEPRAYAQMSLSSYDFIPNIVKIELGNDTTTQTDVVYNFIRYYDVNDNYFQFSLQTAQSKSWSGQPFDMILTNRIYYVGNNTGTEYNNGYYDGFRDGKEEGYQEGKTEGEEIGRVQGEITGYNKGVEEANSYSFLGLMTSVIDAPLQVFTKMFDFNLLGVNMSSFYLSLFTACIIIIILKKVL